MEEIDVKPNIKVEAVDWVSISEVIKRLNAKFTSLNILARTTGQLPPSGSSRCTSGPETEHLKLQLPKRGKGGTDLRG